MCYGDIFIESMNPVHAHKQGASVKMTAPGLIVAFSGSPGKTRPNPALEGLLPSHFVVNFVVNFVANFVVNFVESGCLLTTNGHESTRILSGHHVAACFSVPARRAVAPERRRVKAASCRGARPPRALQCGNCNGVGIS